MHFAPSGLPCCPSPPPPTIPRPVTATKGWGPGSRTTRGLAAVTRTALLAATTADNANAADPVEFPSPASRFRQAMAVLHALGCPQFQKVCVCMRVFVCL